MRKPLMRVLDQNREKGGAAIEYIVISIFGLLLAVAAISFIQQAVKGRIGALEEKLGISLDTPELGLLGE